MKSKKSLEGPVEQSAREQANKRIHNNQWSARKIIATFAAVLLIFSCGVAVGKGDLHAGELKPNGERDALPAQLDYSSIDQVYEALKKNYDGNLSKDQLLDGLKEGLTAATGDPYTDYFNPKEAKEFDDQLAGTFTGIGAELGTDNNNNIVIVSPLKGYPAEKSGLKPKDVIAAIDGQSSHGMSVDEVVKKIRGKDGTKVTLTIIRGNATPFETVITREKITVPSVEYQVDGAIGYIKISQYNGETTRLSQKAIQEFKTKGVKGLVVDLRGNPGGYLDTAVDISSLWLDPGKTIVSERRGGKAVKTHSANHINSFKGIPTVVLIDGGSASASEITAGALKDNNVATLVGTKTFGKGSVQMVINLGDGSELKVTTAHWYTPAGKNINKQGINPDVQVENSDADVQAGRDAQKDKAYQVLQAKIK